MKHTKGKSLMDMHEVREWDNNRFAVMHTSNGSITMYANSEKEAIHKLRITDKAPEMYEALREMTNLVNSIIKRSNAPYFAVEKASIIKAQSLLKEIES